MSQNVAWIDLETTGTDEKHDSIIEIACIVTSKQWQEQARMNIIVKPEGFPPADVHPVVLDMHLKNGLWNDVVSQGISTTNADKLFSSFLGLNLSGAKQLVLAGSGVSHFDRRFIDAQLPLSAKFLTFWSYDVGVVRRFRECAGIKEKQVKKHRAMDDIQQHLFDWMRYIEEFKKLLELTK
jgi:oligoribonuclease